jgi:hypothetical protein
MVRSVKVTGMVFCGHTGKECDYPATCAIASVGPLLVSPRCDAHAGDESTPADLAEVLRHVAGAVIVTAWKIQNAKDGTDLGVYRAESEAEALAAFLSDSAESELAPGVEAVPLRRAYRWIVAIEVADTWVADGFDLTTERAERIMGRTLSYARSDEYAAEVLGAPDAKEVRREQGYRD